MFDHPCPVRGLPQISGPIVPSPAPKESNPDFPDRGLRAKTGQFWVALEKESAYIKNFSAFLPRVFLPPGKTILILEFGAPEKGAVLSPPTRTAGFNFTGALQKPKKPPFPEYRLMVPARPEISRVSPHPSSGLLSLVPSPNFITHFAGVLVPIPHPPFEHLRPGMAKTSASLVCRSAKSKNCVSDLNTRVSAQPLNERSKLILAACRPCFTWKSHGDHTPRRKKPGIVRAIPRDPFEFLKRREHSKRPRNQCPPRYPRNRLREACNVANTNPRAPHFTATERSDFSLTRSPGPRL